MNYDNKNIIMESKKAIVTNQFPEKNNSLSIASLVFGIISLIFCWVFILPIITGIIGIITGCISLVQKRDGLKIAVAGTILSVISLLLGILLSALFIIGIFINS